MIKEKFLNDKLAGKLAKTFVEGFIGSLVVTLPSITDVSDLKVIESILIGAIAMGISAVLNYIQARLESVNE